ncbi:MAG: hypothetical protein LHW60_02125 [Candidatus Cloacimonetes bacterium]|nr:hypothetical protein [Candidatus Cloacimonadota bacterium]
MLPISPSADRIDSGGESGESGESESENIFMNMRYIMCRIGCDAGEIEIDEAVALAELYYEERVQGVCPLMGTT